MFDPVGVNSRSLSLFICYSATPLKFESLTEVCNSRIQPAELVIAGNCHNSGIAGNCASKIQPCSLKKWKVPNVGSIPIKFGKQGAESTPFEELR